MATTVELATGYVTLAVDASKVGAQVGRAFQGAEREGTQAGQKIGQAMAKSFDRTKPDMDKLGADVERAEQRATTAIERNATKQENAKRKVDIAQAKLAESVERYGEKSSQALTAQDRLAIAEQKLEAAAMGARQEQDKLNRELADAKDAFSKAEKAAEDAARGSETASEKYASGWRGVGQKIRRFVVGGVDDATDAADREAGQSKGAEKYASGWRGVGQKITGDLKRGVKSATDKAEDQAERGGREAGNGFKSAFKGAVAGMAAYVGVQEIGQTLWSSVQGAGDLEQSVGAISTVFGDSAADMLNWSDSAASAVGLSKNEFNELGTLIGSQLKNGGTAMDELGPKTNDLITLGSDLASMFGGETSEAVEALSSALKGERDPIERYGVSLNQAAIDAKAAELGFEKTGGALSAEANQAATLALIMEQTTDAHGNFARESDTFAHKQQVMAAQWDNLKAKMGELFLPVLTKVFGFIGEKAIPAIETFAGGLRAFGVAWSDGTDDITSSGFAGFMEGMANNLRDTYDWLAKYAPIWGPFAAGIGIVAAAYGVWAGVSWALTAAQGALKTAIAAVNWPIVAIIAAIGLLIGAFILAYNRIGWFKTAVDAVWAGIKIAISAVVNWLVQTAWPVFLAVLQWIGAKFVWLWQNIVVPAWGAISAVVGAFVTWFSTVAWPVIVAAVQGIGQFFVWLWQSVIVPAWGFITAAIGGFVTWFSTVAWPAIRAVIQGVGQVFMWLWQNVVQPAWTGIRIVIAVAVGIVMTIVQGLVWFFRNVVGPVFVWLYQNIVKPVFNWIVAAAKAWWTSLQGYFNLVKWIIQNVVAPVVMWLWRNVFAPAFRNIGTVVKWAWENVIKPTFNLMKQGLTWVGDRVAALRDRWRAIWASIRAISSAAWAFIRDYVFNPLKQGASWVADRFAAVRDRISRVWSNLKDRLLSGWHSIRDAVFGPLKQGISWVGDRFSSVRNRIGEIWGDLRQKLFNGYTAIRDRTFGPMKTAVDGVKKAFEKAKDGIVTAWDKLEDATKAPVKFFVNTVYNDGMRANVNKVLDKVGLQDKHLPTMSLPAGFARGGVLPGYQRQKRDDQLIPMRSGEGVLVPEVVKGIGAGTIHALNAAGNGGGVSAVREIWKDMSGSRPAGKQDAKHQAAGPGTRHFGSLSSFSSATLHKVAQLGELTVEGRGIPSVWGLNDAIRAWDSLNIIDVKAGKVGGGRPAVLAKATSRVPFSTIPNWAGYWKANAYDGGATDGMWLNSSLRMPTRASTTVTTHEIGHALGLQHAQDGNNARSIMNYNNMYKHNSITSADVGALKSIYPNFVTSKSAKGGVGITTGSGSGMSLLDILGESWSKLTEMLDGAKKLVTDKFPGNVFGAMGGGVAGIVASGVREKITSWIQDKIDAGGDTINNLLGRGDMNGRQKGVVSESTVSEWMTTALKKKGLFSEANLRSGINRARKESNFDPGAINRWDDNWLRGDPSKGLMQVVGSTFNRYKEPGYGDIWKGLDNILASINYTIATYGSLGAGWNRPRGYALGGIVPQLFDGGGQIHEGFTLVEHRRKQPDQVLTHEQWRNVEAIVSDAGKGGQTINVTVTPRDGEDPVRFGRRVADAIGFHVGGVSV